VHLYVLFSLLLNSLSKINLGRTYSAAFGTYLVAGADRTYEEYPFSFLLHLTPSYSFLGFFHLLEVLWLLFE
jgi:hypothetical protein